MHYRLKLIWLIKNVALTINLLFRSIRGILYSFPMPSVIYFCNLSSRLQYFFILHLLGKRNQKKVVIQAWESHKKVKSKYPIYPLNISSRQLAVSCSVLKLSIYHNLHQYYRCQYDSHNNHQLDVQSWSSNIQFQSCSRYIICQWV